MGGQFFQWQFAGAAGLEQHTSGIGIDQACGNGQVFNPEFIQFKIDGFTMYTDIGQMSALLDDVLADILGGFQARRLNSTVHPSPISEFQYTLNSILIGWIHDMGGPNHFGKF